MQQTVKRDYLKRALAVLLALAMLTCCVTSATFAKYISKSSGSDSGRVARWGVSAYAAGYLFSPSYSGITTGTDSVDVSVSSANGDSLLAPGTSNSTGVHFAVTGTPEVASSTTATIDASALSDIYLVPQHYLVLNRTGNHDVTEDNYQQKSGSSYMYYYYDEREGVYKQVTANTQWNLVGEYDFYTVQYDGNLSGDTYYPIQWTVDFGNSNKKTVSTLAEAKTYIDKQFNTGTSLPNVAINKEFTLAWSWAFSTDETHDVMDTILGDLMAAEASSDTGAKVLKVDSSGNISEPVSGTDYCGKTAFNCSLKVVQVD